MARGPRASCYGIGGSGAAGASSTWRSPPGSPPGTVETGRSRASRELLWHLAAELDLPLRALNALLLAAGYAPAHPERPYDHPDMEALHHALGLMLAGMEPNPALVVDRAWNLLDANRAAGLLTAGVDPALLQEPVNVLRLAFHPSHLCALPGVQPRLLRPTASQDPRERRRGARIRA